MRACGSPSDRASGFTLVELLVAISVFALLLGILVPALSGAKHKARAVLCLSRMQQLGQATSSYTSEFGRYPPSLRNTPQPWFIGWSGFDWLGVGHEGDGRDTAPESGRYWPHLGTRAVYQCPADRTPTPGGGFVFSYAMNGRLGLVKPSSFVRHRNKPELPRIAASDLPLFFEEDAPREGCFSGWDVPAYRHVKDTNVGYADGHVARHRFSDGVNARAIYRALDLDPPLVLITDP